MTHQINDPGYGSGPGRGHARILRRDGTLNVRRKGAPFRFSDVYHVALNISWGRYALWTVAIYISVNLLFALIYFLIGVEHIAGATGDTAWSRFADAAYFSAQTLTTVGYGVLAPASGIISAIAALEAMFGLLLFGVFTGLTFGRFSRIKPRISFSDEAIIAPYRKGMNALMFRLANERDGAIMNAKVSVLLVVEFTEDDRLKRRYFDLSLEIKEIKSLALSWTVVHPITKDSPLLALRKEDLKAVNAEVVVILEAFDDTVSQNFYARKSYTAHEMEVGRKFVPMFHDDHHGSVELDMDLLGVHEEAELYEVPESDPTGGEVP